MALHFKWRETKSVGDIVSAASADMVSRWSTEKSPVISMYARDSEIDEDLLLSKASTLAKAEMNAIRSPVWDDGSFRPARTGGLKP